MGVVIDEVCDCLLHLFAAGAGNLIRVVVSRVAGEE